MTIKKIDDMRGFINNLHSRIDSADYTELIDLIDEIRTDHEAELKAALIKQKANACSGCTHEPKSCDPYPTPCGECSRWWSDNFEEKK